MNKENLKVPQEGPMETVCTKQASEMNGLHVPGKAVREVIAGSRKSCTNAEKDKTQVKTSSQ